MNRHSLLFSLLALAAIATPAQAQCPANPLSAMLRFPTWTFNIQGIPTDGGRFGDLNRYAIAGQFTPSIGTDRGGNPIGVLTINATSVIDGSTTRLENDLGRYQINADCTGGTLIMNLSSYPMQYDFWFTADGIYIVSILEGRPATGSATLGLNFCPAGVNPLSLLSGPYALKLQYIGVIFANTVTPTHGMAGRFVPSIGTDRAGNPVGLLAITATSNFTIAHSVTRQESDAGGYQINGDCSGGTLTFNLSSRPLRYQFYFRLGPGGLGLDIINTSDVAIYGTADVAVTAACPVNPLTSLAGPWAFNVQTIGRVDNDANWAAAGRFVASSGTDRGFLNINATSLFTDPDGRSQSVTRLENDFGGFQINSDCTGGTLIMNLSSFPMQYDFWFYNNNRSIYFVSITPGRGATGSATLAPAGCPVGTNPLSLVSGAYAFKFQRVPNFIREPFGIAGAINASLSTDRGGNPLGLLGIVASSSLGQGSITRQESDAGRFQVNDDCSGGTLIMNLSSRPIQYQFYFRSGFREMDVISISQSSPAAFGVVSR